MLRTIRNLRRLWTIGRTLGRYDALFPLERLNVGAPLGMAARVLGRPKIAGIANKRPGERLALALQDLGPAFIKLGQVLSVRSDLLGEQVANDLAELQDHLPPFSGDEARRTVESELGGDMDAKFTRFDEEPIAAASIAQVHRARTSDGRDVAVKVLRPGIESAFAADLDLMMWLAELLLRLQPSLRRLRPVEVVETLADTVETEMDLRLEAAAADELGENLKGETGFRVPAVDWSLTGRRVLTTDWVEGIPVDEREALLEAGHDLEQIVANTAKVFFLQVFRDGFFHADLHPGNLFVDADGVLNAVDFGIMGRLDRRTRQYLAEMLLGFLTGDYRRVAEVHIRAGYVPADQSVDAFAQAARSIAEPILGLSLNQISIADLLAQLFRVTERFKMETQPQLLLLQKTMVVAEGVGRHLYPDVNMWELSRPLIEDWMRDNMGPEAKIRESVTDIVKGLERLPGLIADMEETVGTVTRGGIKLHPDSVRALTAARQSQGRGWPVWVGAAAIAAVIVVLVA